MLCLQVATDGAWAQAAVADLAALLVDHAHCEMKAAANALSLAARPDASPALARALTDLAREEIDHFQRVLALLEARGLPLQAPPVDAYAAALRGAAHKLPRSSLGPLVDRLLVAALIEARSCERFKLIIEALSTTRDGNEGADGHDPRADVLALYRELFPAEARHYRLFVDLAKAQAPGREEEVEGRLRLLAAAEAPIVGHLAADPTSLRATVHG